MRTLLALVVCALLCTSILAQTSEVRELKDAIAAQQQQIQQLRQQMQQAVQSRDQAIQSLQQDVAEAKAEASQAKQAAQSALGGEKSTAGLAASDFASLQHEVADLKTANADAVASLTATEKRVNDLESPLAIHFKGITLTPGGFLSGDTVWRSHATFSDITTQLNGIPFSAAGQARASEFYGSGRSSRLSLLADGAWGSKKITGYYEADFLGAGVTSNNNSTNSYVFRQRQMLGRVVFENGWAVTAGQMWSLVTEYKSGLDALTWVSPQIIDNSYNAGFSYTRQYGFRVTKDFNNRVWLGLAVENAQTLLTVSGAPSFSPSPCPSGSPLVSSSTSLIAFTASCASFNFLIGGPGNPSGAYNSLANYSSNLSPDYIVKAAFEPGFGHYEVFGLASLFRTRIYPGATAQIPTAAGAFNSNTVGGGFGANARWLVAQKHLELGVHYLGGNGVGRYGVGGLPDATVYGNGYQHLIRSYQGLVSIEYHAPKWDLNLYGGGEYAGRQSSLYKGKPVGYGSPLFVNTGCGKETLPTLNNGFGPGPLANCAGNTRALFEGTAMFWYKFYNGPKGRLQTGVQYSYITRDAWSGIGGQPEAIVNMVLTSFRYYLP